MGKYRTRVLVACAVLLIQGWPTHAQDLKTEEAAIRTSIARSNDTGAPAPVKKGLVFWSGAYKAPVMGEEVPVEIARPAAPSNRVSTRSKRSVKRLEVANSGDMAWEYGSAELSYTLKDGTNGVLTNSYLRVWRNSAPPADEQRHP